MTEQSDIQLAYTAFCTGDYSAAFEFAQRAAAGGDAWGWYYLGLLHCQGKGVVRDIEKAENCLARAVAMGCDTALVSLGRLYRYRTEMERALIVFSKAAANGSVRGKYWLGRMYMEGSGADCDLSKAEHLLSEASMGGHAGAQLDLSVARVKGKYGIAHVLPGLFGMVKGFYMLAKGLRTNLHANLIG